MLGVGVADRQGSVARDKRRFVRRVAPGTSGVRFVGGDFVLSVAPVSTYARLARQPDQAVTQHNGHKRYIPKPINRNPSRSSSVHLPVKNANKLNLLPDYMVLSKLVQGQYTDTYQIANFEFPSLKIFHIDGF